MQHKPNTRIRNKINKHTIKLEKELFTQNLSLHQQELTTIISNNESHDIKRLKIIDIIGGNPRLLDQISDDGTTILMLAAAFNQIQIMEVLLEYDNSYSLQPRLLKKTRTDGTNALMIAVMFEHVESINFLLNKAPSLLKMKQKNDTSIIQIAASTSVPKIMLEVLYQHLSTHYRQKGYTSLFKEYKNYTATSNDLTKNNHHYDWITQKNMMLFIMKLRKPKAKKAAGRIKQLKLQKDKNNFYNVIVIRKRIKLNYKNKLPRSIKKMSKSLLWQRKTQIIGYLKHRYCKINSVFRKDFLRFNNSLKLKYPKGSKQIRLINSLFIYHRNFNQPHRQTFSPNKKTIKPSFIQNKYNVKNTHKLERSSVYKMFASNNQRYPNDVCIKGLPMNINESQLKIQFSSYGTILRVKIPEPKKDFCSKIAFITFKNRENALQKFNDNTRGNFVYMDLKKATEKGNTQTQSTLPIAAESSSSNSSSSSTFLPVFSSQPVLVENRSLTFSELSLEVFMKNLTLCETPDNLQTINQSRNVNKSRYKPPL